MSRRPEFLLITIRRLALLGAVLAFACALPAADLAPGVVILANADDPGSLQIAQHYAQQRKIPAANILALSLSSAETITWTEFVSSLWNPLQKELIQRAWIDAVPMTLLDSAGRKKIVASGHRLIALVVCRGVPLRIADDPSLESGRPPLLGRPQFRTNAGAVDSELSLMAVSGSYGIDGVIQNPLFQNPQPTDFDARQIIRVGRLDGPTVEDANALVDRALEAERTGLLGRAYVDIGGSYPDGDRWLESCATQLRALGFDLSVDHDATTFSEQARIDAPVLYFGWYANDLNGPFALPGFRFPPGAIALHIQSFSARTLRSAREGWCGPMLARGVTATMGNVYEPYLNLTHRPDLLLRALAGGATLAEAAYYALPVLSWQGVLVGDPLYRPFAVSNAEQIEKISSLPPRLAPYAELRHLRLMEAGGEGPEARNSAQLFQSAHPNLALGFALAQELRFTGEIAGAAQALAFAPRIPSFPVDQWALAREVANFLHALGRPAEALAIYHALLAEKEVPRELHAAWQREADEVAAAAKNPPGPP